MNLLFSADDAELGSGPKMCGVLHLFSVGQKKMLTQRLKQHLHCVLIALASVGAFKAHNEQQQIKHLFHTRREANTYKRFRADCSFYYH